MGLVNLISQSSISLHVVHWLHCSEWRHFHAIKHSRQRIKKTSRSSACQTSSAPLWIHWQTLLSESVH